MKQTRKILAAMICVMMVFSLCACGTQNRNTGSGEGYASQTSAAYQTNMDLVIGPNIFGGHADHKGTHSQPGAKDGALLQKLSPCHDMMCY